MLKKTHAIAAFTPVFILTSSLELSLYAVLFGLVSDLDYVIGVRHRTVTHSILFMLTISISIAFFNPALGVVSFYGIGSHIFLDMLTKSGVQLYWPVKRRVRIAKFSFDSLLANYVIILACVLLLWHYKGIGAIDYIRSWFG
ncbi:metal-dependent hydrolase [Geoglobus sp.]